VAAARTSSGMRKVRRCAKASAVSTRATTTVQPMPSSPTDNPDSTEVTINISPCTMPTSPLAFARRSGSMRMVTVVDRAMFRIFSTTAPTRMITAKIQNHGRVRSSIEAEGVSRNITPDSTNITRVKPAAKRITASLR